MNMLGKALLVLGFGTAFAGDSTGLGSVARLQAKHLVQSVSVTVENSGKSEVRLLNCGEQLSVPAEGKLDVTLFGDEGFWVVPSGASWSCGEGPFDFFYLQGNFQDASTIAVGFGLDDRAAAELEEEEEFLELQGNSTLGEPVQEEMPASEEEIAEVNKTVGEVSSEDIALVTVSSLKLIADGETQESLSCDAERCDKSLDVATMPSSFRLVITAVKEEASSLRGSFAQRRHHGHGHHQSRHHSHHSHHAHHSHRGGGGWHQGGDKVWGSGAGVESISPRNVGYYNRGMYAARGQCGGPSCALIVNPPGHRTVHVFHIHAVHFGGYGHSLKKRLEAATCGKGGWHGGFPCGGRAAFFPGFPAVFSVAGGVHHASVIAWPSSCGGRGTIVEVAYGCSIEHQIRGDYNPALR